jgi:D-alanyl-D-alanine carboxypeptidase
LGLAAIIAVLSVTSDPADARGRRKRHSVKRIHAAERYNPPYSDIVVDARTGKVLHEVNADALRHPASLTKVMTLYLLFEQLEAGRMTLDTQMPVSELAASQAPTKLGLRAGDTIKVEDAIKGLVTKSANDAAVVIAEAIGGTEDKFAALMTRKAQALGMRHTTYVNANGLPNDGQISTARDQALLGIAVQERFPKYYHYFSLESFVYRGHNIRNHNHLLGKVDGVDGIKTGYIHDSGFNIVTSVKRGPRHLVAVVLGGRSAGSRDARVRELISEHIAEASTKDPVAAVADIPAPVTAATAFAPEEPQHVAAAPMPISPPHIAEATTATIPANAEAPIRPVKVKTVAVKLVPPKSTQPTKLALASHDAEPALPTTTAAAAEPAPQSGVLGKLPAVAKAVKEAAITPANASEMSFPTRHTTRGGWAIQVGAYEDLGEAKEKLNSAKGKVTSVLERAEGYIERTIKGAKTYYRARFAGFDRAQAQAACKHLKKSDIACMAMKI